MFYVKWFGVEVSTKKALNTWPTVLTTASINSIVGADD